MAKPANLSDTRQQLLRAALKHFANSGYAATSVQDIVDDARVSKPALYYHFQDKAGLFQALVHEAHDERYRVLREAAARGGDIRTQLENILAALFDFFRGHRELIRISFATMFAAPGEVPENLGYSDKCERNFEFVHALIQRAQKNGELDPRFDSRELTFGFYGVANFYLVANIVSPDFEPDQLTAKQIVELFLTGAGPKPGAKKSAISSKRKK
jgi:AcrR family transcriptional regulator